jgi:hypothetical protein
VAVISGIGALLAWTLVDAELPRAVANDGLFPKPLAWSDRRGSAWFAVVINAALPTVLLAWRRSPAAATDGNIRLEEALCDPKDTETASGTGDPRPAPCATATSSWINTRGWLSRTAPR